MLTHAGHRSAVSHVFQQEDVDDQFVLNGLESTCGGSATSCVKGKSRAIMLPIGAKVLPIPHAQMLSAVPSVAEVSEILEGLLNTERKGRETVSIFFSLRFLSGQ